MSNPSNPVFLWPLGQASRPDEMNTSYGPRIDADRWDFHDGIDLPAAVGTPVHAWLRALSIALGRPTKRQPEASAQRISCSESPIRPTAGMTCSSSIYTWTASPRV